MTTSFGLFGARPLEQDTGVLAPRYLQEGSTIVNEHVTNPNNTTLYTVTAGKTLYVNTITIGEITGGNNTITVADNATTLTILAVPANQQTTIQFATPLKFGTSVKLPSNTACEFTISGWEE